MSEMNERDHILREMLHGNPALDEQRAEDLIDALVDSVAHTLADEQRAMVAHHGLPLDSYGEVLIVGLTDHIDPKVPTSEGGPVRPDEEPTP